MSTIRKNPLDHGQPQKIKEMVTAGNVDQSSEYREGFCPHCQRAMTITRCDGTPSYVCEEHRTVLPMRIGK